MFETTENTSRRDMLRLVRDRLVERTRRRESETITADDIHAVLNQRNYRGNRQSVVQTMLRSGLFYNTTAMTPSERPVARRRLISEWAYLGLDNESLF